MEFYCIPEFADVHEFLTHVARRIGRLKKGGVPDVEAAARHVLHDWNRLVYSTCATWGSLSFIGVDLIFLGVSLPFFPISQSSGWSFLSVNQSCQFL